MQFYSSNFRSIYLVLFGILLISITLLLASFFLIRQKQVQQYEIDQIETIEYRLPSLDLEKYKQIDKLRQN
jgi:uncharacterized BrkB/YihY/UPF0761 family membrane protein